MDDLHKMTHCPSCAKPLDASTHPEDDSLRPAEGDVSICAYCGEVLEFCADLSLIKAREETLVALNAVDRAFVLDVALRIKGRGPIGGHGRNKR